MLTKSAVLDSTRRKNNSQIFFFSEAIDSSFSVLVRPIKWLVIAGSGIPSIGAVLSGIKKNPMPLTEV